MNGHERANVGEPNDANGILDADVDADGETINAETHVVEDSAAGVSGQDTTNSWSAINVAEVIPLGSTELQALHPACFISCEALVSLNSASCTVQGNRMDQLVLPGSSPVEIKYKGTASTSSYFLSSLFFSRSDLHSKHSILHPDTSTTCTRDIILGTSTVLPP
jgi:hypothetical protein